MRKFIILFIFVPFLSMGQIFKSPNQQFVEQAIKDGFYILKQAYQLEDTVTNQRFGRYGNEDFGSISCLAIRTEEGSILSKNVLSPWVQDENYSRYRDSHRPILSKGTTIEFGDSVFSEINLTHDTLCRIGNNDALLCRVDSLNRGFEIKAYENPKDGWIVWLSSDSIISQYAGKKHPDYTIYKKHIEFHTDSISYKVETPTTTKHIWGGVFLVPEQTGIGQITFFLGGVLIKDYDTENWALVAIKPNQQAVSSTRQEDELTPSGTPIRKEKKNKKKKK